MKDLITYLLVFVNIGLCLKYYFDLKTNKFSKPIIILLSLYPISFLLKNIENYLAILFFYAATLGNLIALFIFAIALLKNEKNKLFRSLIFIPLIFIIIQTLFRFNHYPGANTIHLLSIIPITTGVYVAVKHNSEQAKLSNLFTIYLITNFYLFYIQL